MKRTIRGLRRLLPLLFFFLLLTFSGCQSHENSTLLTIFPDGSGTRVMRCAISNHTLTHDVQGGEPALTAFLQESCPKELAVEKSRELFQTVYTFTLFFDSMDQYRTKAEGLLRQVPEIHFSAPDNIFAKGISIQENVTSQDFMEWVENSVKEAGLYTERIPLFSFSGCDVDLNGTHIFCQGAVQAANFDYQPLDQVKISTKLLENGGYERTISYQIPTVTVEQSGENLNSYFRSIQPKGAKTSWEELPTGKLYAVTFQAKDPASLTALTRTALDNQDNGSSLSTTQETLFSSSHVFTEILDFSSFPSNRDGKTFVEYTFDAGDHSEIGAVSIENGGKQLENAASIENDRFLFSGDTGVLKVSMTSRNDVSVSAVDLSLEKLEDGGYRRELILSFSHGAEKAAEIAASYFNGLATEHAQAMAEDGRCILTITGTPEEITRDQQLVFGSGNALAILTDTGFQPYFSESLEDEWNLSDFLNRIAFQGRPTYRYQADDAPDEISATDDAGDAHSLNKEQDANVWTLSGFDHTVLTMVARRPNPWFFAAMGGIALLIAAAVILLWLLWQKRRGKPEAEGFELLEEICPNCGAFRYAGMRYCTQCGLDLEAKVPAEKS